MKCDPAAGHFLNGSAFVPVDPDGALGSSTYVLRSRAVPGGTGQRFFRIFSVRIRAEKVAKDRRCLLGLEDPPSRRGGGWEKTWGAGAEKAKGKAKAPRGCSEERPSRAM